MTSTAEEMYFDTILPDFKATSTKQLYQMLSKHVSNLIGTSEKFVFDVLMENEALHNSGIGNGVAIADAKIPRLTRPMIIFTKLANAINFNAIDGEPVDMVAIILSPEHEGSMHLQRLAMTTRFFSDEEARNALRKAKDYDSIRLAVQDIHARKKAA